MGRAQVLTAPSAASSLHRSGHALEARCRHGVTHGRRAPGQGGLMDTGAGSLRVMHQNCFLLIQLPDKRLPGLS